MNPAPAVDPLKTRVVQELKHTSPLLGARFDPTGHFVVASAQDNTLQRWSLVDPANSKKTSLVGHKSWVRALAFTPKPRLLFSGDYTGRILVWGIDAEAPQPVKTIEAHKGWVRSLAVSPDGQWLASAGNDQLVRIWSTSDGSPVRTLRGHTCHVYAVAFAPRGNLLVSGDLKGVVKVWDAASGKEARTLDASVLSKYDTTFHAEHGGVRSLAFSPDRSLLACAGITEVTNAFAGVGKPAVVLFDMKTGQRKQLLMPKADFRGTAWGVVFHPSGFVAAAGGGNGGALWFWKPDQPQAFHTVTVPNNARDLDLHPDGHRLAIPCFDNTLRLYDMTPKA